MSGKDIQKYSANRGAVKKIATKEIAEHFDNSNRDDLILKKGDYEISAPSTPGGVVAVCGGDCKTELINFPELGMPGYLGHRASESLREVFGELRYNKIGENSEEAVLSNLEGDERLDDFGMHEIRIRKPVVQ